MAAEIVDKLRGLWRISSSTELGECYGLEVEPDPARGRGVFASLLIWNPGRTGCDTCSSDIVRVPLSLRAGGGQLVATGNVPMTKTGDRSFELTVDQPGERRADARLHDRGATSAVTLEATDTLPVYDL